MFSLRDVEYKQIIKIDQLDIPWRQVVCIFGESGSGKTTFLRLLNHLISCDRGQILFDGMDLTQLDPVALRRRVVMLPQTPVVLDGTIKYNFIRGLEFADKSIPDDQEMEEMLDYVQLSKPLFTEASKLSGGEKQRMALARVFLLGPDVLLLDEPSAALDEETEKIVINKIVDYVQKKELSLIMVTHSKQVVETYAEYTISISEGKLKAAGVPTWKTEA